MLRLISTCRIAVSDIECFSDDTHDMRAVTPRLHTESTSLRLRLPSEAFMPTVVVEVVLLAAWSWLAVAPRRPPALLAGAAMTTGIVLAYLAYVSGYTEVTANVWRHLGYIQWAYQAPY